MHEYGMERHARFLGRPRWVRSYACLPPDQFARVEVLMPGARPQTAWCWGPDERIKALKLNDPLIVLDARHCGSTPRGFARHCVCLPVWTEETAQPDAEVE